jgi:hypothetical protein
MEKMYEIVMTTKSLLREEIETIEELSHEFLLINNKTIVEFRKGQAKVVSLSELPGDLRQQVLGNSERL